MENQNISQEQVQEKRQPEGWKDVNIVTDMPLSAIVQFLNILNHRLCGIEDNLIVTTENGDQLSLTELYKRQAEQEQNNQQGE